MLGHFAIKGGQPQAEGRSRNAFLGKIHVVRTVKKILFRHRVVNCSQIIRLAGRFDETLGRSAPQPDNGGNGGVVVAGIVAVEAVNHFFQGQRRMLHKPVAAEQAFLLARKKYEQRRTFGRVSGQVFGCRKHGHRPDGVVPCAVINRVAFGIGFPDANVVIMSRINNMFVFQFRIAALRIPHNVVRREPPYRHAFHFHLGSGFLFGRPKTRFLGGHIVQPYVVDIRSGLVVVQHGAFGIQIAHQHFPRQLRIAVELNQRHGSFGGGSLALFAAQEKPLARIRIGCRTSPYKYDFAFYIRFFEIIFRAEIQKNRLRFGVRIGSAQQQGVFGSPERLVGVIHLHLRRAALYFHRHRLEVVGILGQRLHAVTLQLCGKVAGGNHLLG